MIERALKDLAGHNLLSTDFKGSCGLRLTYELKLHEQLKSGSLGRHSFLPLSGDSLLPSSTLV
jgi:hypothetical protein